MRFEWKAGHRREIARGALPYAILLVTSAVFTVIVVVNHYYFSAITVYNVFQDYAIVGPVATVLGLVMIVGEFDLSVATMYGLAGAVAILAGQRSPWLGLGAAVALGAAVGLVQGSLVVRLHINSMAVTLGGYLALLGLTYVVTNSNNVVYGNLAVSQAVDAPVGGMFSIRSLVAIGVLILVSLVVALTRWGRDAYAIGGDMQASRIVGISVDRILLVLFVASGTVTALGGGLFGYSVAAATPDGLINPLIPAVVGAIIGGVTLTGGHGTIWGIAAGVLSLGVLNAGLSVVGAPGNVNNICYGALLLIAVILDAPDLVTWGHAAKGRLTSARGTRALG